MTAAVDGQLQELRRGHAVENLGHDEEKQLIAKETDKLELSGNTSRRSESIDAPEVIRRLRLLGEPATLFGESESERYDRLLDTERNLRLEDEAAGGQQENVHLLLRRREKEKSKKQVEGNEGHRALSSALSHERQVVHGSGSAGLLDGDAPLAGKKDELVKAFQAAAEALAERNMPPEDQILTNLQRWMKDWEDDLESRDPSVKSSPAGRQADIRYRETVQYMKPLYGRLRRRSLDPQLLAGIKLIVEAMKDRNYLHAYKIYMGVAIGNSPWPIGVTQVGLHERSAREKISFKYASGSAHIMNDEATRKFIQALKRLMTFCQRRYPTLPSRSVDFDGFSSEGRGAAGAGSDKEALLGAIASGDVISPAQPPSYVDESGSVKIPEKWEQIIRGSLKDVQRPDTGQGS